MLSRREVPDCNVQSAGDALSLAMDCRSDVFMLVELLLSRSQSDMVTNDVFADSHVREAHHHGTGARGHDACVWCAGPPLWTAVASESMMFSVLCCLLR